MRRAILIPVLLVLLLPACDRRGPSIDADAPAHEIRQGIEIDRGLVYRRVEGAALSLDAYRPVSADGLPALVLIHGGGWATGTKDASTFGAMQLARQGFVVFVIDYRLAPPGGRWHAPAQIEDCRAALTWIRDHGDRYGADVTAVGALGSSAGGNLALLLGTTGRDGADKADAVASFSGPTDLTDTNAPIFARQREILVNYLGCDIGACPELARDMSPLKQVDAEDAPIFLANSTAEMVPLDQAVALADALKSVGVPVDLVEVPGSMHGTAVARTVASDAVAFLREHLR